MADSWLTDGNCNECRRAKYCNKPCKAHRQATVHLMHKALAKTPIGQVMSMMQKTMERAEINRELFDDRR